MAEVVSETEPDLNHLPSISVLDVTSLPAFDDEAPTASSITNKSTTKVPPHKRPFIARPSTKSVFSVQDRLKTYNALTQKAAPLIPKKKKSIKKKKLKQSPKTPSIDKDIVTDIQPNEDEKTLIYMI